MTTNAEGAEAKVLSIEDLYADLRKSLKETKDGDAEVLTILERDLIHPSVSEKDGVAKALKGLMDLAATRAQAEKKGASNDGGNTSEA